MWYSFMRQCMALLLVFVNTFMYGCASSWITNAMVFLTKLGHQPFIPSEQYGLLVQVFEVGRLCFAIPAGMLVDRFGRKRILLAIGFLNTGAWALLSISVSTNLIYLSRFILGVAAALLYVSSLTTIGEIASPHYRGMLASINEISSMSGMLFECVIAVASSSYRWLTYSTATAASVLIIPSLYWLLETPHHLVSHLHYQKAKENLAKIRPESSQKELDMEFEQMSRAIAEEQSKKRDVNWFGMWHIPMIRRAFRCGLMLNVLSVACGGPILSLYITTIVPKNRFLDNAFYPLISFLIQFAAAFASTLFIDLLPRRTLYVGAALLSIFMQGFGAAMFHLRSLFPTSEVCRWLLIFNCFLYLIVDRGLISPLNATVRSEIFPQSVKGIGNALCVICQAVTLIISYQVYTILLQHLGMSFNFILFSVNSTVLAAVVYFWLPETRGKSLADVQMAFENVDSTFLSLAANATHHEALISVQISDCNTLNCE